MRIVQAIQTSPLWKLAEHNFSSSISFYLAELGKYYPALLFHIIWKRRQNISKDSDWLSAMEFQVVMGYFMPWSKGITFVVCS